MVNILNGGRRVVSVGLEDVNADRGRPHVLGTARKVSRVLGHGRRQPQRGVRASDIDVDGVVIHHAVVAIPKREFRRLAESMERAVEQQFGARLDKLLRWSLDLGESLCENEYKRALICALERQDDY